MKKRQTTAILKDFQKAPANGKMRRNYFSVFVDKMVYRTTKSENPEVTKKMVGKILHKK